jgi:3-oxoacyl-[acyl-carrier protein] reductase
MFDLTGKIALVTGASRGIGRAIAMKLAEQGALVVVVARGEHAAGTADDIVAGGGRAEASGVDVTDAGALAALPGAVVEKHGRLDIVVSNAGVARDQLLLRMKREDWDAVLATNLTAAFTLAQAAVRPMIRQRAGRIIAITSVVGQMGADGQRRAGQLRRVEGGLDRLLQGTGARGRLARHHRERHCAGSH